MNYFEAPAGEDVEPLRIFAAGDLRSVPLADGIDAKPVIGSALNFNVVELQPGALAALHAHDEEQMGYVVRGSAEFTDGVRSWTLGPGDCYHAGPRTPHGARALDDGCTIIDCFSPPRAGLRELLGELLGE